MDRIDAMRVFVAALDEGSLARAGHKLGRSAAAVSRAIAFLEQRVGVELLHRTTRALRLSEAGERYAVACRRILSDLDEADVLAAGERSSPRGTLTVTAPVAAGEKVLLPLIEEFMDLFPDVCVRLHLFDRMANLVDEGIDLALRFAHLPDSNLTGIKVGDVRRVVVASPAYLARHPPIVEPKDIERHHVVAMTHFGMDSWSFPAPPGTTVPRAVQFEPRFTVNSVRAAVASAVAGRGVTRLFSYHVAEEVHAGALALVLTEAETPPLPVHLIGLPGRMQVPKVRSFVDFAASRLRDYFDRATNACRD